MIFIYNVYYLFILSHIRIYSVNMPMNNLIVFCIRVLFQNIVHLILYL